MKICPNCGFECATLNLKCAKCGLIFQKWEMIQARALQKENVKNKTVDKVASIWHYKKGSCEYNIFSEIIDLPAIRIASYSNRAFNKIEIRSPDYDFFTLDNSQLLRKSICQEIRYQRLDSNLANRSDFCSIVISDIKAIADIIRRNDPLRKNLTFFGKNPFPPLFMFSHVSNQFVDENSNEKLSYDAISAIQTSELRNLFSIKSLEEVGKLKFSNDYSVNDHKIVNYFEGVIFGREQHDFMKRQPIPSKIKREVWRRDMGKCIFCGSNERLEYDHIIPVSKGGSNTARNIQLLCEKCNRKKASNI
jgi:hypothetical protein